jgi:hypothetical protein
MAYRANDIQTFVLHRPSRRKLREAFGYWIGVVQLEVEAIFILR